MTNAPPPGYVAFGDQARHNMSLATPRQRIGARIIDIIVWIVVSAIVNAALGVNAFDAVNEDVSAIVAASLISGALIVGYEVFMTISTGATLGKKMLNLRVVDENGAAPQPAQMFTRMSTYIVAVLIGIIPTIGVVAGLANFGVGLVSLVFLFTDDRRQAVWDKLARTVVRTV